MGHLGVMGTSKRHANKELIFQFTTEMLCHRTPPGPTSGRPQRHPRGQLPGWGMAGDSQRGPSLLCSNFTTAFKNRVLEALVPKPLPHLPSPPPPRGPRPPPCPCRTLLTWQRAGSGQQVALNSCHNGRALGCGGSEPRPERQRWHGGGRRQVRVWRVRHGHRQVRWGERGRGEREMVVMPMQVRRRGEVNTDGVG